MCFYKVQIGNVLGISLNIDCMEKTPAGFRLTFSAFSAMSSNYNNELRTNNGTQTPREISIMSFMQGRGSSAEADSFHWARFLSSLNLVFEHDAGDDVRLILIPGCK